MAKAKATARAPARGAQEPKATSTTAKRGGPVGTKVAPKKKARVRRSAEAAHEQILDAAEKRLAQSGPRGIRLQELAADVGVSHPTILHHFGSREALVEAVVSRALAALQAKIVSRITADSFEAAHAKDLFRQVFDTLGDRGHARLMAWLALEGRTGEDPDRMLLALGRVMQARRAAELGREAPFEDTLFTVLLVALALFGEGVLGDGMLDSAGLGGDPGARERFHTWLIALVDDHLHRLPDATS